MYTATLNPTTLTWVFGLLTDCVADMANQRRGYAGPPT